MGVIYLQHPIHGIHVATTEVEAANCRLSGWSDWKLGDPDPVVSPRQPIPEVAAKSKGSEVEDLKAQLAAQQEQMAALLARLDKADAEKADAEKADADKPVKKTAAAPAVPDFLKDGPKP